MAKNARARQRLVSEVGRLDISKALALAIPPWMMAPTVVGLVPYHFLTKDRFNGFVLTRTQPTSRKVASSFASNQNAIETARLDGKLGLEIGRVSERQALFFKGVSVDAGNQLRHVGEAHAALNEMRLPVVHGLNHFGHQRQRPGSFNAKFIEVSERVV